MGRRSTSAATTTRREAARAYDATVRAQSLDKPLNFPDDLSTAPGVYVPKKKKRVASSRFRGVSWIKTRSEVVGADHYRWEAEVHRQLR